MQVNLWLIYQDLVIHVNSQTAKSTSSLVHSNLMAIQKKMLVV